MIARLPNVDRIDLPTGLVVAVRNGRIFVVAPGPYAELKTDQELTEVGSVLRGDLSALHQALVQKMAGRAPR